MLTFVAVDLLPPPAIVAFAKNGHLAANDQPADLSKAVVPKKESGGKNPSTGAGAGEPSHTKDIWLPKSDAGGGGIGTGAGGGHTKDKIAPPEK